ncbi:telomere repeats-binding bouquet formation protein 1 isoform X11 [Apteryx rowi]|uniref:telomere repeats-binding bouquet formation protein 1 isoform X11 n=1 Tax=Apteryx rowi TaxID=308060 RepID=UPI000E1D762D|nr:telomere repeats-binding bouquet formation protein 1 isoform X11 [Apteryx rowi]
MENQKVQRKHCDVKTDLNLLLECLKYQMDCPMSQKEALITIYSICQQNSEASEYFREIGGLMFINDLAKSSVHCIVKEAALFTLGIIIESNVYCQQTLCTPALFEDLISFLMNKDSGVNLKRMSVYVILVLVSNNKNGQTYVRETGCIGLLLQLFRTTLSISEINLSDENINQCYQLWSSVCSTLCACVNNPQNATMGVVLAKYHTVSELLKLLPNDTLDTGEKISIILTIGHCTEVCEENQYELLKNNGLPLMIQVLTESQDEELNKAATFVLQNCKQMTEQLSLKINENSSNMNSAEQLEVDVQSRERTLQDYWKKAKEILHRINLIEKEHDKERVQRKILVDRSSEASTDASKYHEVNTSDPKNHIERTHKVHCPQLTCKSNDWILAPSANSLPLQNEILKTVNPINASTGHSEWNNIPCSVELQTDSVLQSHSINEKNACEKKQSVQVSEHLFKQPAKIVKNLKQACTSDQHSSYAAITKKEKSILTTSASLKTADLRCLGCTAKGLSFNSKTFSKMLQTCPYPCDRHKVILEAEKRYKKELRKLAVCNNSSYAAYESILLTPIRKNKTDASNSDEHSNNIWLTEKYNLIPTYERCEYYQKKIICIARKLICIT